MAVQAHCAISGSTECINGIALLIERKNLIPQLILEKGEVVEHEIASGGGRISVRAMRALADIRF